VDPVGVGLGRSPDPGDEVVEVIGDEVGTLGIS
jgi:hypothetical protein